MITNSTTFNVIKVSTYSEIPASFSEDICYYTIDTDKHYAYKNSNIIEIFESLNSLTLDGYIASPGVVSASDTILTAIEKLDGNIQSLEVSNITVTCRNQTGSTLYRGTIVYINGSTGNLPTIQKAQANSESTSARTFGVVVSDILNNGDGLVLTIGALTNLDTRTVAPNPFTADTLVDGNSLYLSPTNPGYVTNVKPSAPNHLVYIGRVIRTSPTNGYIEYQIQNGYELEELHNAAISSPADKDVLMYNLTSGLWENKPLQAKTKTDNDVSANAFTYNANNGLSQKLSLSAATGTVTVSFSNQIEGNTYTLVVVQGSGLYNLTFPTGWWINSVAPFNFSSLANNSRALVTITYLDGEYYYAVKELTYA